MTIERTVEIPASHWLTLEVPREIPAGRTIVAFTPVPAAPPLNAAERRQRYLAMGAAERAVEDAREAEIINRNAERLNREMEDVLAYQGDIFKFGSPFTEDDFVLPFTKGK
ncbi:MAG: hypothetical protein Pg6C_03910 [Treponemataceae bacterium]|nr:MAG: hypothetical protein Pg6C_03910 [Treponemataceae bacterium]